VATLSLFFFVLVGLINFIGDGGPIFKYRGTISK